jgi:hypothetical protein
MTTTTAKTVATKATSSSTALVSLAVAKKAVKKATKAKRVNPSTIKELSGFDRLDKIVINAEGKASEAKAKLVAFLNKLLLNMDYATFCATQTVIKEHHMANAGVSIDTTNTWWSKLGLSVKKPSAPSDKAVAMQAKRKGAKQVKGAPKKVDNRVTPLSTKLQEIKTQMLKRDMYSVKAGTMLNLLIAEFITCEKVEKAVK